jgi:hypothetical protein
LLISEEIAGWKKIISETPEKAFIKSHINCKYNLPSGRGLLTSDTENLSYPKQEMVWASHSAGEKEKRRESKLSAILISNTLFQVRRFYAE